MINAAARSLYGDELYHHGVEGMQWGVQNGPPYPLSGDDKKAAKAQYKENKRLAKEAKIEKKRQKIINKANVDYMRRHKELFTTQEIANAVQKRALVESTRTQKLSRKKRKVLERADLDAIKKDPKRYSSEDMEYALRRRVLLDEQRKKSKDQVKKEHEMQDRLAKMQKAAQIASAATTIIGLGTAGLNFVNAYKTTKIKDEEADDKRWKTQFDSLKQVNKTMALKSFNDYWKTDYKLSKDESDAQKAYSDLWTKLGTIDPVSNEETYSRTLNQLKTMSEIISKSGGGKDKDKD